MLQSSVGSALFGAFTLSGPKSQGSEQDIYKSKDARYIYILPAKAGKVAAFELPDAIALKRGAVTKL